jgi:hypothetical protein
MPEKYLYTRYTWWKDVHIDRLVDELASEFEIINLYSQGASRYEISLYSNTRREIMVKADTLNVYISRFRAVLFQKIEAPFTKRDLRLRERILKIYPRITASPLPFGFSHEPKFEVQEEKIRV